VRKAKPIRARSLAASGMALVRLAMMLSLLCSAAKAQIFHLQAGDSTLSNSYGASIGFQAPGYEGWIGAGKFNGAFGTGAFVKTDVGGFKVRAGDDAVRLSLPTDVLGSGSGISYRGVGVEKTVGHVTVLAFGGVSSFNYSTGFFQAARVDTPVGGLYFDLPLSSQLSLFSRNVFSTSQTSIQGICYRPRKWLTTAVATGIGSGAGLFSTSVVAERSWMSLRAEYADVGDGFRRFVMQPNSSEVQGKNILATFRPKPGFSFGGSYQHVFQPMPDSNAVVHGSISSVFVNGSVQRVKIGGSFNQSQVQGQSSQGYMVNGSYRIAGRVETSIGYFASRSTRTAWQNSMTGSTRETITSRFKLVQTITNSAGQTNVVFGGDLVLRRATIGIDHQTVYLPFAGGGFKQVLSLNLRLRPFGQFEVGGKTVTTPDGRLKYTASAGDYVYRYGAANGEKSSAMAFSDHVVRGCVTDEKGSPIAGAALHIDGVVAYTDSDGKFLVRMKKAQSYPFRVALDEFVTPELYEVVSAPAEVTAADESTATEIKVVLRRVPQTSHGSQLPESSQSVQRPIS